MTYFIIVSEVVGQVEQLNLIHCDTNKELFDKLNHNDFQDIEFVDSMMGLAQNKKAMLIRGEVQMPVKTVEWDIEPILPENYYNSTEKQKEES